MVRQKEYVPFLEDDCVTNTKLPKVVGSTEHITTIPVSTDVKTIDKDNAASNSECPKTTKDKTGLHPVASNTDFYLSNHNETLDKTNDIIVAVEIGLSYSRIAMCLWNVDDPQEKRKILAPTWVSQNQNKNISKTSTALLVHKDNTNYSIGYNAEYLYSESYKTNRGDCLFFKRFYDGNMRERGWNLKG
ncbi:AFF2 [Mytilus edulis]|uniref:AFF2 n=1 Tax=Mytilus edulis TaxID=6550 RepID=A0A8S3VAN9_MYTED|nr:AFF2 [Mytilus edulis]